METWKGNQLAEINEEMDALAKEYLRCCDENESYETHGDIESHFWSIWIDGKKIVRQIDETIKYHIHGKSLLKFLKGKGRLTDTMKSLVDWKALKKSSYYRTHADQLWCTKVDSGFFTNG